MAAIGPFISPFLPEVVPEARVPTPTTSMSPITPLSPLPLMERSHSAPLPTSFVIRVTAPPNTREPSYENPAREAKAL